MEPETLPAPDEPEWASTLGRYNCPGEIGGVDKLHSFDVDHYDNNNLGAPSTSGLSPHLRFGEVSPATVWAEVRNSTETPSRFCAN